MGMTYRKVPRIDAEDARDIIPVLIEGIRCGATLPEKGRVAAYRVACRLATFTEDMSLMALCGDVNPREPTMRPVKRARVVKA